MNRQFQTVFSSHLFALQVTFLTCAVVVDGECPIACLHHETLPFPTTPPFEFCLDDTLTSVDSQVGDPFSAQPSLIRANTECACIRSHRAALIGRMSFEIR